MTQGLRQLQGRSASRSALSVQAVAVGDKMPDAKFKYFDAEGNMKVRLCGVCRHVPPAVARTVVPVGQQQADTLWKHGPYLRLKLFAVIMDCRFFLP